MTAFETKGRRAEILLIEDNPGDVRLIKEALKECRLQIGLHVVGDGAEALAFLNRNASPADLIVLDLNLPGKDGREILAEIKGSEALRRIPVIILTTSEAKEDICQAYDLQANCYITKPMNLDEFERAVRQVGEFWFSIAALPPR